VRQSADTEMNAKARWNELRAESKHDKALVRSLTEQLQQVPHPPQGLGDRELT
jgi:hypothetical protein